MNTVYLPTLKELPPPLAAKEANENSEPPPPNKNPPFSPDPAPSFSSPVKSFTCCKTANSDPAINWYDLNNSHKIQNGRNCLPPPHKIMVRVPEYLYYYCNNFVC